MWDHYKQDDYLDNFDPTTSILPTTKYCHMLADSVYIPKVGPLLKADTTIKLVVFENKQHLFEGKITMKQSSTTSAKIALKAISESSPQTLDVNDLYGELTIKWYKDIAKMSIDSHFTPETSAVWATIKQTDLPYQKMAVLSLEKYRNISKIPNMYWSTKLCETCGLLSKYNVIYAKENKEQDIVFIDFTKYKNTLIQCTRDNAVPVIVVEHKNYPMYATSMDADVFEALKLVITQHALMV